MDKEAIFDLLCKRIPVNEKQNTLGWLDGLKQRGECAQILGTEFQNSYAQMTSKEKENGCDFSSSIDDVKKAYWLFSRPDFQKWLSDRKFDSSDKWLFEQLYWLCRGQRTFPWKKKGSPNKVPMTWMAINKEVLSLAEKNGYHPSPEKGNVSKKSTQLSEDRKVIDTTPAVVDGQGEPQKPEKEYPWTSSSRLNEQIKEKYGISLDPHDVETRVKREIARKKTVGPKSKILKIVKLHRFIMFEGTRVRIEFDRKTVKQFQTALKQRSKKGARLPALNKVRVSTSTEISTTKSQSYIAFPLNRDGQVRPFDSATKAARFIMKDPVAKDWIRKHNEDKKRSSQPSGNHSKPLNITNPKTINARISDAARKGTVFAGYHWKKQID